MRFFRYGMLTAALAAGIVPAAAADLKNCNEINSTRDRTECLNANLILLNSSYETVARELREAVAAAKETNKTLQGQIDDLRRDIANIKPTPPPDLSSYIAYGAKVQLESVGVFDKQFCLDHDSNNSSHVQGWLCSGAQKWQLNK